MHNAFGDQFVITSFSCTPNPSQGGNMQVSFPVENRGSAPISENWPVAVVLVDPVTRAIKWKSALTGLNIRSWLPGNNYNFTSGTYDNPPSGGGAIFQSVAIPPSLSAGNYLVELSILDPTSGLPGVFFAVKNFFKQSLTQPLCQIRVGSGNVPPFDLPNDTVFDSLVNDDTRSYNMPLLRTNWVASASSSGLDAPKAIDGIASSRWSTGGIQNNTGNEFNVYAPTSAPQFTGASPGYGTENAFDGVPATRWDTGDLQKPGQWFEVNLRSNKSFTKIVLDTMGPPNDYPRGYRVEISSDRVSWTEIAAGQGQSVTTNGVTTIPVGPQVSRFIRVWQTAISGSAYWSIHEFRVEP